MNVFRSALCLSFALLHHAANAVIDYHEQLVLQPLPLGQLLASFAFRSNASLSSYEQQHFQYFPRSLGQVLQHAHTKELHLRFSSGRWDAESWGTRPWAGTKEGGTGVELWAWVEADSDDEAFERWTTLNHALSGLFCASMNFIDSTRTSRPVMTFEPLGDHGGQAGPDTGLHLLHGTLPHEVVCTENLTPFLKLLPCKGKAGIASLLDGHRLFDSSWQTMSIDVRPICPRSGADDRGCVVEIAQAVDMVLDIERSQRPHEDPIPRPLPRERLNCDASKTYSTENACYPTDVSQGQSWSIFSVFGQKLKGTCLASTEEEEEVASVCINVPNEQHLYASGGVKEYKFPSGNRRCLIIPSEFETEVYFPQTDVGPNPTETPLLYAERSITGHGQERGGVQAFLTNPSPDSPVEFIYFEALPWYMKPYLHTLKVQVNGKDVASDSVIRDTYYQPGLDRKRGTQLEMHLVVPAASTITLTYDFEKAILRYTEYPPDANRGFDVAPAVVRVIGSGAGNSSYLRTTSMLLPLPTPDFSMPYNVIILTSTVMALAFGNIFNLLVRRFVGADEVPSNEAKGWRALIRTLTSRFSKRDMEKKTQ